MSPQSQAIGGGSGPAQANAALDWDARRGIQRTRQSSAPINGHGAGDPHGHGRALSPMGLDKAGPARDVPSSTGQNNHAGEVTLEDLLAIIRLQNKSRAHQNLPHGACAPPQSQPDSRGLEVRHSPAEAPHSAPGAAHAPLSRCASQSSQWSAAPQCYGSQHCDSAQFGTPGHSLSQHGSSLRHGSPRCDSPQYSSSRRGIPQHASSPRFDSPRWLSEHLASPSPRPVKALAPETASALASARRAAESASGPRGGTPAYSAPPVPPRHFSMGDPSPNLHGHRAGLETYPHPQAHQHGQLAPRTAAPAQGRQLGRAAGPVSRTPTPSVAVPSRACPASTLPGHSPACQHPHADFPAPHVQCSCNMGRCGGARGLPPGHSQGHAGACCTPPSAVPPGCRAAAAPHELGGPAAEALQCSGGTEAEAYHSGRGSSGAVTSVQFHQPRHPNTFHPAEEASAAASLAAAFTDPYVIGDAVHVRNSMQGRPLEDDDDVMLTSPPSSCGPCASKPISAESAAAGSSQSARDSDAALESEAMLTSHPQHVESVGDFPEPCKGMLANICAMITSAMRTITHPLEKLYTEGEEHHLRAPPGSPDSDVQEIPPPGLGEDEVAAEAGGAGTSCSGASCLDPAPFLGEKTDRLQPSPREAPTAPLPSPVQPRLLHVGPTFSLGSCTAPPASPRKPCLLRAGLVAVQPGGGSSLQAPSHVDSAMESMQWGTSSEMGAKGSTLRSSHSAEDVLPAVGDEQGRSATTVQTPAHACGTFKLLSAASMDCAGFPSSGAPPEVECSRGPGTGCHLRPSRSKRKLSPGPGFEEEEELSVRSKNVRMLRSVSVASLSKDQTAAASMDPAAAAAAGSLPTPSQHSRWPLDPTFCSQGVGQHDGTSDLRVHRSLGDLTLDVEFSLDSFEVAFLDAADVDPSAMGLGGAVEPLSWETEGPLDCGGTGGADELLTSLRPFASDPLPEDLSEDVSHQGSEVYAPVRLEAEEAPAAAPAVVAAGVPEGSIKMEDMQFEAPSPRSMNAHAAKDSPRSSISLRRLQQSRRLAAASRNLSPPGHVAGAGVSPRQLFTADVQGGNAVQGELANNPEERMNSAGNEEPGGPPVQCKSPASTLPSVEGAAFVAASQVPPIIVQGVRVGPMMDYKEDAGKTVADDSAVSSDSMDEDLDSSTPRTPCTPGRRRNVLRKATLEKERRQKLSCGLRQLRKLVNEKGTNVEVVDSTIESILAMQANIGELQRRISRAEALLAAQAGGM